MPRNIFDPSKVKVFLKNVSQGGTQVNAGKTYSVDPTIENNSGFEIRNVTLDLSQIKVEGGAAGSIKVLDKGTRTWTAVASNGTPAKPDGGSDGSFLGVRFMVADDTLPGGEFSFNTKDALTRYDVQQVSGNDPGESKYMVVAAPPRK
jgi:hypothetical protein